MPVWRPLLVFLVLCGWTSAYASPLVVAVVVALTELDLNPFGSRIRPSNQRLAPPNETAGREQLLQL
jgi:hypothetical protein